MDEADSNGDGEDDEDNDDADDGEIPLFEKSNARDIKNGIETLQ